MTMTPRYRKTRIAAVVACLFLLSSLIPLSLAPAADEEMGAQQADATEQAAPLEIEASTSTFEYQIEGRPDPFMPFVTESTPSTENPDEIVEEDKVLTGMQLFEPSQLTLVALMLTGADKYAMVQDFNGKGYVIKEGTKIGRRGVVTRIIDNKVIIEETAQTRSGKMLTNEIAMLLKKEGEE